MRASNTVCDVKRGAFSLHERDLVAWRRAGYDILLGDIQASLESNDMLLDIYYKDLSMLINSAVACYGVERQQKGYLAWRPLGIVAVTQVGARCEDGNVFYEG